MHSMQMKNKIKLLLADDHPVVLTGLKKSLSAQRCIQVVGEASNGREVLRKARQCSPHIILMDISMPGMSGLAVMKRLRRVLPAIKVIAFTMHDDKEYIQEIVRYGGKGYVLKEASPLELIHAIETVAAGGSFFSATASKVIVNEYVREKARTRERRISGLTRREEDVVALIANGASNKEAANQLKASLRTIEKHRERIMKKLHIHHVVDLTRYAIEHQIIKVKKIS